jgi:hypothetical protein
MCCNKKERKNFNVKGRERELQHQGERERASTLGKKKNFNARGKEKELQRQGKRERAMAKERKKGLVEERGRENDGQGERKTFGRGERTHVPP